MPNGFTLDCWMNNGQDAQSDPNPTQTETPLVHRITVMPENTETQKADDGLGHYKGVEGGAVDKEKMEIEGKNNTPLGSGKGGCCSRFMVFCLLYKLVVAIICLLIILVIVFFALYMVASCKLAKMSAPASTASTPSTAPTGVTTPMPGPTGVTSPTPMPGPTVLPTHGAIIQGIVETTENYTAALENDTSLAYTKFKNRFIAAVMCFYAHNDPVYLAYYEGMKVTDFEKKGKQAIVHFEVYFSQLDNDSSVPDAHTVLLDQVNTRLLSPFAIITGTIRKTEN
ncbi:uncharacterized protein LOC100891905 isoform X3 [Strongylocentrotus purpuratus]|uniref:SEA domain-containing protein n=1 Tax=Strongylocentrotus purpuratus TaxID=7668 RepID=A0A7M7STM1_STRPU|nr:uncharacterized protein LOC100891905 isoform X2 [Strongylocentrotus purpuratus]XP_030830566.1 uncharacterized protein LOC100891905 isoform X3 [Strongylocentrotus purpuratus]